MKIFPVLPFFMFKKNKQTKEEEEKKEKPNKAGWTPMPSYKEDMTMVAVNELGVYSHSLECRIKKMEKVLIENNLMTETIIKEKHDQNKN